MTTKLDKIISLKVKIRNIGSYDPEIDGYPPEYIFPPSFTFTSIGTSENVKANQEFVFLSKDEVMSSEHVKEGIWWWGQAPLFEFKPEHPYQLAYKLTTGNRYKIYCNNLYGKDLKND